MVLIGDDSKFFIKLEELPSEIITTIIDFIPICALPELLCFLPIQEVVASKILSNVSITDQVERHKWSNELGVGYSKCSCQQFEITLNNLKEGIHQWNVFPSCIQIDNGVQFSRVVTTFPEILIDALSINCSFNGRNDQTPEVLLRSFLESKIKLDCLSFSNYLNPITIPPVARSIQLLAVSLASYVIPGVKKLNITTANTSVTNQRFLFSSDLEDLKIVTNRLIEVTLPPILRKLEILAELVSVNVISEELFNLEYLVLKLPNIQSFDETGIIAPNLQKLTLHSCEKLSNFEGLRQFRHLKHLEFQQSNYPIGLFNEDSFLKLENLQCLECRIPSLEGSDNSLLTFPPNLKVLRIQNTGFQNVNFSSLVLPTSLEVLNLRGIFF